MDAATWDQQPYWAQIIYIEGLKLEKPWLIRLTQHPDGWLNPFEDVEETFADINLLVNNSEDESDEVGTLSEELRGLPDIKSLGAKVVK